MSRVLNQSTKKTVETIQQPVSKQSPHHTAATTPSTLESRKRRREDDLDDLPLVYEILPCPHSQLDTSFTIASLCLVPRAQLPLSWLDSSGGHWLTPNVRFFSASIAALEPDSPSLSNTQGPMVLMVRPEDQDTIYAVERVAAGVYTSCRLGSWITNAQLKQLTYIPSSSRPSFQDGKTTGQSHEWWMPAIVRGKTIPESNPNKKARPEDSTHVPKQDDATPSLILNLPATMPAENMGSEVQTSISLQETAEEPPQASPVEIVTNVVSQYLETLYLSTASLAYFAKGPLSRARTFFTGKDHLVHLPKALRDLVLTIPVADKRYKETILETLKMRTVIGEAVDHLTTSETPAKRASKRKRTGTKRSKDGLLPAESDYIVKWWLGDDIVESANSDFRTRVSELRFRETLLQLLLILEILAIEASLPREADLPEFTESTSQQAKEALRPTTKAKKPKDFAALAETLIDRLTIWQSIEAADDGKKAEKSVARSDFLQSIDAADNSDRIKDFCVEVVMPFYGGRLPDLVTKLRQKMGLPSTSPTRRRKDPSWEQSFKARKLAPGTVLSRDDSVRRRPLERVSSDTSESRPINPPSLLRSATESSLQNLKRERSSTPHVPFARLEGPGPSRPASRAGSIIQDTKDRRRRSLSRTSSMNMTLSKREVDTSVFTKFKEAKAKKAALVEEEIRGAIANIKKPNRTLAVKEIVDEAEARSQRTQRPNGFLQRKTHLNVQVNATPKRVNRHTILGPPNKNQEAETLVTIPSSDPFIPASAVKNSLKTKSFASSPVAQTPLRPPMNNANHDNGDENTPLIPPSISKLGILVPTDSIQARGHSFTTPTKVSVLSTPLNSRGQPSTFAVPSTPASATDRRGITSEKVGNEDRLQNSIKDASKAHDSDAVPARSIYESLGWDDDMDELM